ncbi:MAG: 50S ribosomal protein L24 [Lentisphaerae bacterium]|nr:50S ribosomal protein L24 [Lentisphaerota bacterium]
MSVPKIKKNDVVIAIAGVNAGKTGKVLQVFPSRGRVIVEGLNLIKKNMRKSQDNPNGAVVEKEASMAVSNLMLYCPECKKGVRILRIKEGKKRIRKCKLCVYSFDS